MIDFHTHTLCSDGYFLPAEHIRRAVVAGYKVVGITDHVDFTNMEQVYTSIVKLTEEIKDCGWDITVIPGIEITHVPASRIEKLVGQARTLGVPLIIMHGESPVEPVEKGTNRAAIEAGVDIVAHPGLITDEDVKRAAELGVSLEISARKGHSITNGHVAKQALRYGAKLTLDSDAHSDGDFLTPSFRQTVMTGCGMDEDQIKALEQNMKQLAAGIWGKL